MAIEQTILQDADLCLQAEGLKWYADVEAQGAEHLRVRLRASDIGVGPQWPADTRVECFMATEGGRYNVEATVLRQEGDLVWLRIPPSWNTGERRRSARVATSFPVTCKVDGVELQAFCRDLSVGGMRLRMAKGLRKGTRIELWFTLSDDPEPLQVEGTILYQKPAEDMDGQTDLGIKFSSLDPADGARIARSLKE